MNATKRSIARAGLVLGSVLVIALTGCRTRVIHETRTVYVPAPAAPQPAPQVVYVQPAPQPPPPVVVVQPPEPTIVVIQSENDFYEPLAAYGRWVMVGSHGRVWVPARVEPGWRPYSNGYWERTDAGWYWASEEPWGWATYHYGRWDFHANYGWVWVPQTQWAPAWVSWREGGGYVGWAPLRPTARPDGRVEHEREPAFDSRAFVFVEHRRMLEPVRAKTVIVNNTTIINQTVNITQVTVVNKTVINEGPRPEVIERESGRKVRAIPAREVRHREEAPVASRQHKGEKAVEQPTGAPQIEKPAGVATQPHQPIATPTHPVVEKPVRVEKEKEIENGNKVTIAPPKEPATKPVTKPEAKPKKAVLPPQDRPVEKPAAVENQTPQPVATKPIRNEKKHEPVIEKRNVVTPPAIESNPRRETNAPAKVEAARVPAVKKQPALPPAKPANKKQISPKQKSPAAEHIEASKKKQEAGDAQRQGDKQATPTNGVPMLPPQ